MPVDDVRHQVVVEVGGCMRVGLGGEVLPRVSQPSYLQVSGGRATGGWATQASTQDMSLQQQETLAMPQQDSFDEDSDGEPLIRGLFNQLLRGFDLEDGVRSLQRLHSLLSRELLGLLPANTTSDTPLDFFFVVPPCATESLRERLASLAFDCMRAEGFFITQTPTTSLYSAGLISGVAVDVGNRGASVSIVSNGVQRDKYTHLGKYGGQYLTDVVRKAVGDDKLWAMAEHGGSQRLNIKNKWLHVNTVAEGIKEHHAYTTGAGVAPEEASPAPREDVCVGNMPDGTPLCVPAEAITAADVLVTSSIHRHVHGSLPNLLRAAVNSYDADDAAAVDDCTALLESALFISGGATLTKGLMQHLFQSLVYTFPAQNLQKPIYHTDAAERRAAAWTGASIAAHHMPLDTYISRESFDEQGPRCVHAYCPA